MSRWSIFWYFTGNFWSKRRKSRWRSVRRPYWISDKKLSGFRILVQRPSNTPKIIKIGQPCLWTCLHGFLVDMLLNLILLGLEISLYNLYKIRKWHKKFPCLILSPKSHVSVLSASKPFRKYIVYNTLPGIEFTILYNGDKLRAM